MLISVHMPKAAGTTFLTILESIYADKVLLDYGDKILSNSVFAQRKNAIFSMARIYTNRRMYSDFECVHGHFMPLKYRFFCTSENFVLTWFRHPVQRLISHYHYWKREARSENAGALRRRVLSECWSLRKFCLSEELRNIYSRILWGFPLSQFDFIGITEFFEEDIDKLSRSFFGFPLDVNFENSNPNKEVNLYSIDKALVQEIEAFHDEDMALYQEALKLRRSM